MAAGHRLWHKEIKSFAIGAAAVISAAVLIGGVFAYYTSKQAKTNTITVGQNTTAITEEFDPEPDQGVYKKAVQIANMGNVPCYVRVFIAFSDEEAAGISQFSADGKTYFPVKEYRSHLPAGWVSGVDGYLYYTEPLLPGGKTSQVISSVKTVWPADMDRYVFDLIVREESVQVPVNSVNADYTAAWAVFHAGEAN